MLMKKLTAAILLLALFMTLPLSACFLRRGEHGNTAEPAEVTANPTAGEFPSAEPPIDPVPTQPPQQRGTYADYSFDPAAHTFSDDHISFTVPAEQTKLSDITAFMRRAYDYGVYLQFYRDISDISSTAYYTTDAGDDATGALLANMTQAQCEAMLNLSYSQAAGGNVAIETLAYHHVSGEGYSGIIYEYEVSSADLSLRQLFWSVVTDDSVCLTVAYTGPAGEELHTTVDSIVIK